MNCPKCGGTLIGNGRGGAICSECGKEVTKERLREQKRRQRERLLAE